jgi:hypothetical protein
LRRCLGGDELSDFRQFLASQSFSPISADNPPCLSQTLPAGFHLPLTGLGTILAHPCPCVTRTFMAQNV